MDTEQRRKLAIGIFEAADMRVESSSHTWFVYLKYAGMHMTAVDLRAVADELDRRNQLAQTDQEQAHEARKENRIHEEA